MVDVLCELLACRRAMKEYGCRGWFAYCGCPPEMPYQAVPSELWRFFMECDTTEGEIIKAGMPQSD